MRIGGRVRHCQFRAAEIHKRERRTTDAALKSFLAEIEAQWRVLARSYRVAERLSQRNGELRKLLRRPAARQSSTSAADGQRRATHS